MAYLTITIDVKNKIQAYKVVNKLGYENKIIKATYLRKTHTFSSKYKLIDFLREKGETSFDFEKSIEK